MTRVIEHAQEHAIAQLTPLIGRRRACEAAGVPQANWYRKNRISPQPERPSTPRKPHPRALSDQECERVRATLNSERFWDSSPTSVYYTLLDEGIYLASESTMYRILRRHSEAGGDRRRQATHPPRAVPEACADAPNIVWAWDITRLKGPTKGRYFYLYTIIDLYSRYVVGWMIAARESAELARTLISATVAKQAVQADQLTIHSDRGSPMISKTVAQLLVELGVVKSHSRPRVSNDNPHIEASFKTLKYCPAFPERFGSIEDARLFCRSFYRWYNDEHYHSGINFQHPADVHHGRAATVRDRRAQVLAAAHAANPDRFVRGIPTPPSLPGPAWINKPLQEKADADKTTQN